MPAAALNVDAMINEAVEKVDATVMTTHGFDQGDPIWREDPTDFDTFVVGKEHLNLPPLYDRQAKAAKALLGGDAKKIFEEPAAAQLKPLKWRRFKSSNVARAAWTLEHGLVIEFAKGGVYAYIDAPKTELAMLVASPSKGKVVQSRIKKRFRSEKIDVAADELRERTAQRAMREYQIAVLLWGKGSGKDYLSSIIVCYLLHVLLCLRDPQPYFGLAPGEPIDIINVAYNADQAKRVFFEKLKQRMFRWKWLRARCDVFEAGRRKWPETAGRQRVEINDQEILFPRFDHEGEELGAIRAFSKHAENESYEGLNIIAWVMDEASAFLSKAKKENASKIYQTLRTSAASRFLRRWVGFIISYPRHADDFTMVKCREARANPTAGMYADGPAATWEVNTRAGQGEWVEVRPGHKVPVEFANDYILDFEEALARYECHPPMAKDALIKQPERVWSAVQKGRKPVIEWEAVQNVRTVVGGDGEEIRRRFAGVKITATRTLPKGTRMYFHGDPAEKNDSFALAFGHGVPATIIAHVPAGEVLGAATIAGTNNAELMRAAREGREPRLIELDTLVPWERDVTRTVIDAMIVWRPDPRLDMAVDLLNVREVLLDLVGRYRIAGGSFDKYESAETVQMLQAKKLPVENEAWSNPFQHRIYRGARSAFYNDLVTLPDTPSITSDDPLAPGAIYELVRVEELEGHKIDHPADGSKDLADALVRIIEHVTGEGKGGLSFGSAKASTASTGYTPPPGRAVNPDRTPSPISQGARDAEAKRAEERPDGQLVEGLPAAPRRGGMSFGSATRR